MRRIFILFFISVIALCAIVPAGEAHAATLSKPANNLGLVGWWTFDEGTSTIAHDFSGNGIHGTLTNMESATDWVASKRGKGLVLDGSNEYITTQNKVLTTSDFSFSLWVKNGSATQPNDTTILTNQTDAGNYGVVLANRTADGNGWNVFYGTGAGSWIGINLDKFSLPVGEWTHVAFTKNGAVTTIYLNGTQASQRTQSTATVSFSNASNMWFGNGAAVPTRYFNGSLDDIRFYSRVLSPAEIANQYRAGAIALKQVSQNGLVGWWKFDEGTSTIAHDFSGNGNNGTLSCSGGGCTVPAFINGKRGKALDFSADGTLYGVVNLPGTVSAASTNRITVSAWYYKKGGGGDARIVNRNWCSAGSWLMHVTVGFGVTTSGGCAGQVTASFGSMNTGQWYFLTGVFDGTNVYAYKNGVLISTNTGGGSADISANVAGLNMMTNNNGYLDDVRIYNRVLSATEISNLYAEGQTTVGASQEGRVSSGLVGYWSFNGRDTTWTSSATGTARDLSGNGNTGTITNMSQASSPVAGKVGQALMFDGSDDHINLGAPASLNLGAGDFALCAWIKTTGTEEDIFSNGSSSNGKYLLMSYSGKLRGHVWYSGFSNVIDSNATVNDGKWHHGCQVVDATNISLYVDGALDKTQALSGTKTGNSATTAIGHRNAGSGTSSFGGDIDEVRVYNRAITADEVKQLYLLGR